MSSEITVACVCVGIKYDWEYVEHLREAVLRHLRLPYRFTIITDDTWPGWWGKMHLFEPGRLGGRVIYLDLDTLVIDSLLPLAYLPSGFYMLRDFLYPERCGSGVMVWDAGSDIANRLYNVWKSDPDEHMRRHALRGDQEFIEQHVDGPIERLQDHVSGIVSVRVDCNRGASRPPAASRLVCFHGAQKPHTMPEGSLLRQIWLGETC